MGYEVVTYDTLGNERHKAVCELRKMKLDTGSAVKKLAIALGIEWNADNAPKSVALLQKRLIHLLGGDQQPVKMADLFGILKDGGDDVRGSVAALGDPAVRAAAGRGDDIHSSSGVEGLAPITTELRRYMEAYKPTVDGEHVEIARIGTIGYGGFVEHCDAIDAVHAALERENAELRERVAVLDESADSMHDGGSITDELRGWYKDRMFMGNGWQELDNIADRIDAEHESACAEAYGNGVMSVPIALDENQWVKLPLDADGVPIRVEDEVVDELDELDESTAPRKVTGLYLANDGWWVYIGGIGRRPSRYRHHHDPTVEDVLLELLNEAEHFHSLEEERDAISEYAKRLTLAESE